MKRFNKDFLDKLGDFNLEVLENSKYSIYALSKDLKFIYFNPAWFNFAVKNKFDETASRKLMIGTSVLKSIKGIRLKLYFRKHYKKVIRTGEIWHHQYQCSSHKEYRFFHQTVYPLHNKAGVLIVNTEMFKLPMSNMSRETFHAIGNRYIQPNDHIVQCSNCRHTQRADQLDIWDWVPDWVEKLPPNHSLSICPTCEHLYKDA